MESSYSCIFSPDKRCSVKKEYKLRPESLVQFCQVCDTRKNSNDQTQIIINSLVQFISTNVRPILKDFSETQRLLGKAQAEAEIYKKLFDERKRGSIGFSEKFFEEVKTEMVKQAKDKLKPNQVEG